MNGVANGCSHIRRAINDNTVSCIPNAKRVRNNHFKYKSKRNKFRVTIDDDKLSAKSKLRDLTSVQASQTNGSSATIASIAERKENVKPVTILKSTKQKFRKGGKLVQLVILS